MSIFATFNLIKAIDHENTYNYDDYHNMIKAGANPNAKTKFLFMGKSVLQKAIEKRNNDAVVALVHHGAHVKLWNSMDNNDKQFLFKHLATTDFPKKEYLAVIHTFVKEGFDLLAAEKSGDSILLSAAMVPNREVIKIMIDAGVDVNVSDKDGNTPLEWILSQKSNSYNDLIEQLIEAGANVNARGFLDRAPMDAAIENHNQIALDILIKAKADVNYVNKGNGRTPLRLAFIHRNTEAILALMKAGADLDFIDKNGDTPLHEAAAFANEEVLRELLHYKIMNGTKKNEIKESIDRKNKKGETPLTLAKRFDQFDAIIPILKEASRPSIDLQILKKDKDCTTSMDFKSDNLRKEGLNHRVGQCPNCQKNCSLDKAQESKEDWNERWGVRYFCPNCIHDYDKDASIVIDGWLNGIDQTEILDTVNKA